MVCGSWFRRSVCRCHQSIDAGRQFRFGVNAGLLDLHPGVVDQVALPKGQPCLAQRLVLGFERPGCGDFRREVGRDVPAGKFLLERYTRR